MNFLLFLFYQYIFYFINTPRSAAAQRTTIRENPGYASVELDILSAQYRRAIGDKTWRQWHQSRLGLHCELCRYGIATWGGRDGSEPGHAADDRIVRLPTRPDPIMSRTLGPVYTGRRHCRSFGAYWLNYSSSSQAKLTQANEPSEQPAASDHRPDALAHTQHDRNRDVTSHTRTHRVTHASVHHILTTSSLSCQRKYANRLTACRWLSWLSSDVPEDWLVVIANWLY